MFTTNRHTTPLRYIPALLAVAALGLSACSTEELPDNGGNSNGKTAIEFAMSNTGGIGMSLDSRAAASDASRAGFGSDTRIVMRIGSTDGNETKYTRTTATASAQVADYSTVSFDSEEMRYWDDAHGRNSQLSVYAVAIPDNNSLLPKFTASSGSNWATETSDTNNCIAWKVSADQTAKVASEDLCFSNNIQTGGKNGVYRYNFTAGKYPDFPGCNPDGTVKDGTLEDGIMQFTKNGSSEVGKFDLGHLIFRHALTRITVKLIAGEGYDPVTAFNVEHVKINNVTLTNDATTLNVTDGAWSGAVPGQTITKMSLLSSADAGCDRQLVAHTIPGDVIPQGGATKRIEIVVDGNIYYLTDEMLYESFSALAPGNGVAIEGTNVKLEQSKNYEINVRVSKKRIDEITATVVPWATVAGKEKEVNNAYITLNLYNSATGDVITSNPPKFYRLDDPSTNFIFNDNDWVNYKWYTTYERHTDDLEWDATNSCWKSKWYFENNRASYHFRMTNDDANVNIPGSTGTNPFAGADYLNITTNSTDIWWGAPMRSGANLVYDFANDSQDTSAPKGGYSSSLHWGIAATEDTVKMTLLHIKSQIDVVLKTSTLADGVTPAPDAVKLQDGVNNAVVKVVRAYSTASVELGRGMVKTTGTTGDLALNQPTSYFKTDKVETNPYWLYYVPQPLSNGSNYVGIEITTPDGNIYKINRLSDITVSSVSSGNGQGQTTDTAITRWLPNHHYTYTFTLKKTEVTATATVTKWNEVTADKEDVTIE